MLRNVFAIILACFIHASYGQSELLQMNNKSNYLLELQQVRTDSSVFDNIRPYIKKEQSFLMDSLPNYIPSSGKQTYNTNEERNITVSGLLTSNYTYSTSKLDKNLFELEGGTMVSGNIHPKFAFSGLYVFHSENMPRYIDTSMHSIDVVPGMGKRMNGNETAQLSYWQGYLSYSPNRFFNFNIGRGKHFWGDGYRSLWLSDNASPYPYMRITSKFWHVKYINLYSWHKDIYSSNYGNKFATSHMLSWNIVPKLNFSLFESVVWQGKDTLSNRGFDVNYLNPAIFYRSLEYAQGSSDNSLIGASMSWKISNKYKLYTQLLLDEFYLKEIRARSKWWANKQAFQVGVKAIDLFGMKNLSFQSELNWVRPFTYSHISSLQSYTNMNQSLAIPAGANLTEVVNRLRWQKGRLYVETQVDYLNYGEDSAGIGMGANILESYTNRLGDYHHLMGQGINHKVLFAKMHVSLILNSETNLRLFVNYIYRKDRIEYKGANDTQFIQFGISSRLWNTYRDF